MAGPQFSRYPSSSTPRGPRGVGGGVGTGCGGVGGGVGAGGGVGVGLGVGVGVGVGLGVGGAGLSQSALFWQTVTPSLPQIGPDPAG
jgi:hypothetical protein